MSTTASLAAANPTAASPPLDHLSWSGIQCYLTCGKRFHFRYIAGATEERKSAALIFGGSFHKAAEAVYQARMEGREIPAVAELLAVFDETWKEESAGTPELVFAKDEDAATSRETAARMLEAFRAFMVEHISAHSSARILAVEHKGRFPLVKGAPAIEARLDVVELEGRDLVISELKTAKSRWSEAKVQENLAQVVLYAFVLVGLLKEFDAVRVVPQFIIVSKAKKPAIQLLRPKAEQSDVTRLREQVAAVWGGIEGNIFPAREGWWCGACPFRVRCLGR